MPRRRLLFPLVALVGLAALGALVLATSSAAQDLPGVSAVTASKPSFAPGESITITVVATDDSGVLRISSNLPGTTLSVTACSVNNLPAATNTCTGSRTAVTGQGTRDIYLDTVPLDGNPDPNPNLTVTLTLTTPPSCTAGTSVTVDADQPNNAGPDLVTINCIPHTPTPTPTNTATPTPTFTPVPLTPTPTPAPPTPTFTPTPITQVLSSGIQPPNTGDAGLK